MVMSFESEIRFEAEDDDGLLCEWGCAKGADVAPEEVLLPFGVLRAQASIPSIVTPPSIVRPKEQILNALLPPPAGSTPMYTARYGILTSRRGRWYKATTSCSLKAR